MNIDTILPIISPMRQLNEAIGIFSVPLDPDKQSSNNIVGSHLGGVQFIKSILRNCSTHPVCIFAPDVAEKSAMGDLKRMQENEGGHYNGAHVIAYSKLPQFLSSTPMLGMHDTSGPFHYRADYLRNQFASTSFPVTCTVHGFSQSELLWNTFARLVTANPLPCDSVICTTNAAQQAFQNLLNHVQSSFQENSFQSHNKVFRTDVIPLGIDTESYRPRDKADVRRLLGLPQEDMLILSFGRIDAHSKGDLFPLLKAFSALNKQGNKRLKLVLAGKIDRSYEMQRIQQIAQSLQCASSVIFRQSPALTEGPLYYAAADIFVGLSETPQESYGLAPLEAMASGLPVIVSDWSGYRETVTHGETGFRVDTYWMDCSKSVSELSILQDWSYDHLKISQSVAVDIDQLTHYLELLVERPDLRASMGEAARQRVTAYYSCDVSAQQHLHLWTELAEIARILPPQRKLETPLHYAPYFNTFKHFATHCLSGNERLAVTAAGRFVLANKDFSYLHKDLGNSLDINVLAWAIKFVKIGSAFKLQIIFDDLARQAQTRFRMPIDIFRTHIMWLLKYGLLKIAS